MMCALGCRNNKCFATAEPTFPVPPMMRNFHWSLMDDDNDDDDGFGITLFLFTAENAAAIRTTSCHCCVDRHINTVIVVNS